MSGNHYDVAVIGTGPGGEGAAMQAVKLGRRVAAIERMPRVGGACTHQATIPSKALRHAISQMTAFNAHPLNRRAGVSMNLSFQDLLSSSRSVIERQVDMRRGFYERNGVPVVHGTARFLSPHEIEAVEPDGAVQLLIAKAVVIAAGSRPYRPPEIDFTHPRVLDSDTVLSMAETPSSITIYGAGVVGCEYASMFKNLGVKVNLINTRGRLLEFLDDEITDALGYHLRDQGVLIRHNEICDGVEPMDDGVVLSLRSGKKIKSAALLWANGRTGNTAGMGLEEIGIRPNVRGQIDVNENFQTAVPSVYAVGDVTGPPALASAAYVQGRFAALHAITGKAEHAMVRDIPTGIYTTPEISSIGRTEAELTSGGVPYEVGHALFKSLARAQIAGQTAGMLKLLFHRDTLEILGIHCFGENASEIIHIGQAIMAQPTPNNSLEYFLRQTFNYPTMAEAYRVAALNGYNRLF